MTTAQDNLTETWRHFFEGDVPSARNDLVLAYLPLVDEVVRKLPHSVRGNWDTGDLRSFGLLGLVDAIGRWRPGAGEPPFPSFPPYARTRIRGSVFDELRRLDWMPRAERRRVTQYWGEYDAITAQRQRLPACDEVVDAICDGRRAKAATRTALAEAQLLHLDAPAPGAQHEGEPSPLGECIADAFAPDPALRAVDSDERSRVRTAIAALPERQRVVIANRYLGEPSLAQVGQLLGVSPSRVCQIEGEALRALRTTIHGDHRERGRAAS